MAATPLPALQSGRPTPWEEAVYAFLVEKRARSGSTRTVEGYARMLWPFFAARIPDQVRPSDVLAYARGIGVSGRTPSSATIGARIACLSSFYRFAIRMGLLVGHGFMAATKVNRAGNVADRPTLTTETKPSSSGCRSASRTSRPNSSGSSQNRTPWSARVRQYHPTGGGRGDRLADCRGR